MKTIVITGPSGSGKTHLANKLAKDLNDTILITTDSYYRDDLLIKFLSIFINDIYDRIISLKSKEIIKTIKSIYNNNNNEKITFYNYEFKNKRSSQLITKKYNEIQFLIIEGIFAHRIDLDYTHTINILCQENKELCYQRRLMRDKKERGRSRREVDKRFNKSWNLFFKNLPVHINNNKVYKINPVSKLSYYEVINNIK